MARGSSMDFVMACFYSERRRFGRRKPNKHRVPFAVSLTIIIVTIMVVLVHFWFYCDESVSRDLCFQCLTRSIGRDEGPLACRKISF